MEKTSLGHVALPFCIMFNLIDNILVRIFISIFMRSFGCKFPSLQCSYQVLVLWIHWSHKDRKYSFFFYSLEEFLYNQNYFFLKQLEEFISEASFVWIFLMEGFFFCILITDLSSLKDIDYSGFLFLLLPVLRYCVFQRICLFHLNA